MYKINIMNQYALKVQDIYHIADIKPILFTVKSKDSMAKLNKHLEKKQGREYRRYQKRYFSWEAYSLPYITTYYINI